jgi:hypothetical protein
MTSKSDPEETDKGAKKLPAIPHPGMMGDGTEEQNLGQRGSSRREEVTVESIPNRSGFAQKGPGRLVPGLLM